MRAIFWLLAGVGRGILGGGGRGRRGVDGGGGCIGLEDEGRGREAQMYRSRLPSVLMLVAFPLYELERKVGERSVARRWKERRSADWLAPKLGLLPFT